MKNANNISQYNENASTFLPSRNDSEVDGSSATELTPIPIYERREQL